MGTDLLHPEHAGRRIGYARVSTTDQRLDMQINQLQAYNCSEIFKDHGISGSMKERPGLDKALKYLQQGDILVVYKLDRLGRSVLHLADLLKHFEEQSIGFCSLTEGINTTTSGGKLVYHVFSAVAQFQRDLISENTINGIAAARARGKKIGRPYALDDATIQQALDLIQNQNMNLTQAARHLNIPRTTLGRAIDRI